MIKAGLLFNQPGAAGALVLPEWFFPGSNPGPALTKNCFTMYQYGKFKAVVREFLRTGLRCPFLGRVRGFFFGSGPSGWLVPYRKTQSGEEMDWRTTI